MRYTTLVLNIFHDVFLLVSFFVEFYKRFLRKLDVGDFTLASISGITESRIHCTSREGYWQIDPEESYLEKNYSSTRLIYDRFTTSTSANFENPYKMSLSYFNDELGKKVQVKVGIYRYLYFSLKF